MSSPTWRTWSAPLAVALLSASGLLSALVTDGYGDAWAWFALGVPVLVSGWAVWPRKAVKAAKR